MRTSSRLAARGLLLACLLLPLLPAACTKPAPLAASSGAAALDVQVDWTAARLIVVQDGGRYKTLESLARECFADMTRTEHLPGLSPLASLCEWVFNRDAYRDSPLIKVREAGLRDRLSESFAEARRTQVLREKLFTPRELEDPAIEATLRTLETQPLMRRAANRVRNAQALAEHMHRTVRIVPQPGADAQPEWHTPTRLLANLEPAQLDALGFTRATLPDDARAPIPGLAAAQAFPLAVAWLGLEAAWRGGDAAGVQKYLQALADGLPRLASAGVYPSLAQRSAEVKYYQRGKFTGGWVLYFFALLFSIPALVTRWRVPWIVAFVLTTAALAFHGYGLLLRWEILGRIPVANMFEAVVAAAWMGIALALLLELWFRSGLFLVGATMAGWLALVAAGYVLPGGELATIPGILDDIQLRIHTVMIIAAYALIFIAAVIAVIYLIGYYSVRLRLAPQLETALAPAGATAAPGGPGAAALALPATPMGVSLARPLLAGAAPGDEAHGQELPAWLNAIDWSHLILLNMAFVLLFLGGIILGAWWADYSWGRPWGWDPKEVFALNTWLIYAILLHVRFVVRRRGLWTAWLSIVGCAMMAFNWFFVNFFINSVHSYA